MIDDVGLSASNYRLNQPEAGEEIRTHIPVFVRSAMQLF